MNEIIQLPDGTYVGTGLLENPEGLVSSLPVYEAIGPLLSDTQIEEAAKSGLHQGRDKFDTSYIKNQRNRSSCNGFAGASGLTRARVRRGLERVDLSGAYLYSLINGGIDRGSMLDDGMNKILSNGICTEATVSWDEIFPYMYDIQKANAEAANYKGFECYAVRTKQGLLSALACDFDCIVAVHVGNRFTQLNTKGISGSDSGRGNHAVCVDGIKWDDGILIDMANSWGTSFGNNGRSYLTWEGHLAQTTPYHVFYAIRSTTDNKV